MVHDQTRAAAKEADASKEVNITAADLEIVKFVSCEAFDEESNCAEAGPDMALSLC